MFIHFFSTHSYIVLKVKKGSIKFSLNLSNYVFERKCAFMNIFRPPHRHCQPCPPCPQCQRPPYNPSPRPRPQYGPGSGPRPPYGPGQGPRPPYRSVPQQEQGRQYGPGPVIIRPR